MSGAGLSVGDLAPRRRRLSLTPMIDVVFLLLVFFMLASRFSVERRLDLGAAGSGGGYRGGPRLVSVGAEGVRLNGTAVALEVLPGRLAALAPDRSAAVILRADGDADAERLVAVIDALSAAGWRKLVLAE